MKQPLDRNRPICATVVWPTFSTNLARIYIFASCLNLDTVMCLICGAICYRTPGRWISNVKNNKV